MARLEDSFLSQHVAPRVRAVGEFLGREGAKPTTLNRYTHLATLAAALAGGAFGVDYLGKHPIALPHLPHLNVRDWIPTQTSPDKVETPRPGYLNPFIDKDAAEVASKKGIDARDYVRLSTKTFTSLQAFKDDKFHRAAFPPAVATQEGTIARASTRFDVPKNMLGSIMTVESCGWAEAGADSVSKAQGLLQVMAFHFQDAASLYSKYGERRNITDQAEWLNPDTNIKFGMYVFMDFLSLAKNSGSIDPEFLKTPLPYMRALMGYNGGNAAVTEPIDSMDPLFQDESRWYGDYLARIALDIEVVKGLSEKGFSESEIRKKMKLAPEVRARAYGLEEFLSRHRNSQDPLSNYNYLDEYNDAQDMLVLEKPGIDDQSGRFVDPEKRKNKDRDRKRNGILERTTEGGKRINQDYNNYKQNPGVSRSEKYPMTPSVFFWSSMGGLSLLETSAVNRDLTKW